MVSSLLVFCALFGSQSDTVSLWQSGKPFSQVAASIAIQSGTPIEVDEELGEIRVSAFCTAVTRDRALAALAVILDAKVVAEGDGLRIEKDAAVWRLRDSLTSELESRAKRVLTKMRDKWIALGIPASWEAAQELSEKVSRESFRRRAGVVRASDLTTEEDEVERGTSHFIDWPFAYLCSQMSDEEFAAFLVGGATFASSVPVQGVTQVEPGGSQKGKTVSWVYWYVPEDGRVVSVSHEIGYQNRYVPMSNGEHGTRYDDIARFDVSYSHHLHSQMKGREDAQLELLQRDTRVKSLTRNQSVDSFHQSIGRSGRPIVALFDETGSFLTNPDLSVFVGGIIAIKPKLHWRPRASVKNIGKAFAVELFHDPVKLFDAAAELRLNGDAWSQHAAHHQYGGGEHIGDYPDLGANFARLWSSLSLDQKRQMLGAGLAGGALSPEQLTLFKRAVYRSFFNGNSPVFPLQYLAPSQLVDCVMHLEANLGFSQQWKRKSDGKEAHRSVGTLKQTRFAVEDQWYVATSVSVAYMYELKIVSNRTEVFSHHGWICSELARGNLSTLKAAVDRFRREFGVE